MEQRHVAKRRGKCGGKRNIARIPFKILINFDTFERMVKTTRDQINFCRNEERKRKVIGFFKKYAWNLPNKTLGSLRFFIYGSRGASRTQLFASFSLLPLILMYASYVKLLWNEGVKCEYFPYFFLFFSFFYNFLLTPPLISDLIIHAHNKYEPYSREREWDRRDKNKIR